MLILFTTTYIQASQLSSRDELKLNELEEEYASLNRSLYRFGERYQLERRGYAITPEHIIEASNNDIHELKGPAICSCCCFGASICLLIALKDYQNPNCEAIIKAIPATIGLLSGFAAFPCCMSLLDANVAKDLAQQYQHITAEIEKYNPEQLKEYERRKRVEGQMLQIKVNSVPNSKKMQ